jgi:phage recombination protein Bet
MSNDLVPIKGNALTALAARLECDPAELKKTLKATAFANCQTDEQFMAAVIVANTYGLNPILKELYAFPGKAGQVVPMVSIDGWIRLVQNQATYNGVELREVEATGAPGGCAAVVATFYRKDQDHPTVVTEYMNECYDGNKEPWKRWPRRMLRHKAYIQGARIAFGFGGIYDEDEAHRISEAQEADYTVGKPPVAMPQAKQVEAVAAEPETKADAPPARPRATAQQVDAIMKIGEGLGITSIPKLISTVEVAIGLEDIHDLHNLTQDEAADAIDKLQVMASEAKPKARK